jgi:glycine/D-amino acid oxidase-like deaminating enzyme
MDKRIFLKLLAATALAGCAQRPTDGAGLNVVVAGAGVVGASIAYHLAKSGASVTVIDREGPATHASRGTFAWINATWAKQPRAYHKLNRDSLSNWKLLQDDLNLPIRWTGSLEWFDGSERQQKLVAQIEEQQAWGEPARMVEASELAALEPNVDFNGASEAALSENDGAIDPVSATTILLRAAEAMGAVVKFPCELTGVSLAGDRLSVVETSLGPIKADRLVLATGAAPDAPRKFAETDVPQRTTPGIIAITAPMAPLINRIIVAPGVHIHQRQDGRLVLGEQDGPPKNEAHAMRLAGRPNQFPERIIAEQHAGRMLAIAEKFAPGAGAAVIEDVYIGWRPLPIDGHPVLGASPNRPDVYLAIMHSGVSLAPIIGQLAAYELIRRERVERLDAYRPGRVFKTIKRY